MEDQKGDGGVMATAERRVEEMGADGEAGPAFDIRSAGVDDGEALAAIEARSFSNPWQPQTFRSLIAQGRAHILVAEDAALEILGYAVVWWVHEQGELANLAVTEEYQGRGIGSALLDKVLADVEAQGVESLFLEVRMSNQRAIDLYLSRDFEGVAVRRDYYRNPREDARILVKKLKSPGAG